MVFSSTGFATWLVFAGAVVLDVLVHDRAVGNARNDLLAGEFGEDQEPTGRLLLLVAVVVDLDDLFFALLLGQRLAGGDGADVVNGGEARRRHLFGLVLLVDEPVLALLVRDVDRLAVLAVRQVHDDGYATGTARRLTGIGDLDGSLIGIRVTDIEAAKAVIGFFQTIVGREIAKTDIFSLSF